jgi:hypothetical protein
MDPALEGCPTRLEFERSVSKQLGYDPFGRRAQYQVLVRATATASGSVGRLVWSDARGQPQGERELVADHRDCRELARSMVFAMVVQLQLLDAASPKPEPGPAQPGEPSRPVPPEDRGTDRRETADNDVPPDAPSEADEPIRVRSLGVGIGPVVAGGLAPEWSVLGRLYGVVRFHAISLELGAAASWPSTWQGSDGKGFRMSVQLASFAPCVEHGRFGACALTQLGRVGVEGTGLDVPRRASGLLGQGGLRLALSQPVGALRASLHLEALQTFTKWTVEVDGADAWTMPNTTVQIGLDVEWPLWVSPWPTVRHDVRVTGTNSCAGLRPRFPGCVRVGK